MYKYLLFQKTAFTIEAVHQSGGQWDEEAQGHRHNDRHGWMGRCVEGWMDGWMDGWMGGWTDGRTNGQIDRQIDRQDTLTHRLTDILHILIHVY